MFEGGIAVKKLIAIFVLISLLFAGCSRAEIGQQAPAQCRTVTGVHVTFDNGPLHTERQYTVSSKVRAILNYLRWLDPYGLPEEDPEMVTGSSFRITLQYSDGCEKNYVQKADRFFLEDGKPWRRIDPTRAQTLSEILGQMASDSGI
jgi:hypothetical protein